MSRTIMILDTPKGALKRLVTAVEQAAGEGAAVTTVTDGEELLKRQRGGLPSDLVLLDSALGDGGHNGLAMIESLRGIDPNMPIVAVASKGDVNTASKAIRAGATDFLVREGSLKKRVETMLTKLDGLLHLRERNRILDEQNRLLSKEAAARYRIIGESPQIRAVIDRIERVARIPRPVLIVGERGTGKELIARAVHEAAGLEGKPFVAVNCAAFPDTLLENELFGHERGAFTGADGVARGKFEQAAGGILFLDEIGNMSLPFQQKILRVVEYGTFTRVGGRDEIRTDARIIAATNADLKAQMDRGEFLPDLYDRLTFEILRVPALREREGDIEILARHFLQEFMAEIPALGGKRWSRAATDALRQYSFPGNIRELKNIVERAAYRDTTNEITPVDIGMLPKTQELIAPGGSFKEKVAEFERRMVLDALEAAEGNQARAARELGLSYHQFRYYYKKYGE